MSRIGNAIIIVPKEATVETVGSELVVKGKGGELRMTIPVGITVTKTDDKIEIARAHNDKKSRAIHGFVRAHLANLIMGVTGGWKKVLELSGVGYRASMTGVNLNLSLGFSHPVVIAPQPGITFSIVDAKIVIAGADKQQVGQVAATIRELKKPEPYKGKGIKYEGEHIRKKAGKAAKAVGAPGAK
jgi:large subunit ribosomal protein L6